MNCKLCSNKLSGMSNDLCMVCYNKTRKNPVRKLPPNEELNKILHKMLLLLVGFAVGALLGDVFIHLLPEVSRDIDIRHFCIRLEIGNKMFRMCIEILKIKIVIRFSFNVIPRI